MKIIGYTFDAGCYCVSCTQAAWADKTLRYPRRLTLDCLDRDHNHIPIEATDIDGNQIFPVHDFMSTDTDEFCSQCRELVLEGYETTIALRRVAAPAGY